MNDKAIVELIIFLFLFGGCSSSRKTTTDTTENLNDVYILTILVQDHLRVTKGDHDIKFDKVIASDSLHRISKNFKKFTQINDGGHIALQYWFSDTRNINIELTDAERKRILNKKILTKHLKGDNDGEIQFEYGERFYNLKKILVNQ